MLAEGKHCCCRCCDWRGDVLIPDGNGNVKECQAFHFLLLFFPFLVNANEMKFEKLLIVLYIYIYVFDEYLITRDILFEFLWKERFYLEKWSHVMRVGGFEDRKQLCARTTFYRSFEIDYIHSIIRIGK